MKRVLLALCLIGAAVPSTTFPVAHAFDLEADDVEADDVMSKAMLLSHPCVQSTKQDEVHAVVVDTPKVISLTYASPDTWDELPMAISPYNLRQLAQRSSWP